jgi:four helix bundle protein
LTGRFPKEEIYGLTSQLRRAVISISSNIAEGCGRRTSKDFVGFLYNAMGSVREVESQLMFVEKLGYLEDGELRKLLNDLDRLGKMLMGFIKHISRVDIK